MSILEEAVGLQTRQGAHCSMHDLGETNPTLYAEVLDALTTKVQGSALSRALKAHDIVIAPDTLNRHRRGDCVTCRS